MLSSLLPRALPERKLGVVETLKHITDMLQAGTDGIKLVT